MSRRPPGIRAGRATLLAIGGLVAFVLVAGTTLAVAGALVRTSSTATLERSGTVERVVIDVDGEVVVRPGPTEQVRVERRSEFAFSEPGVELTLVAGEARLEARCGRIPISCTHRVALTVPASAEVVIDAYDVDVEGLDGAVTVRAPGGSVRLADLGGTVRVEVGGGAIVGTGLRSDTARADAAAGHVQLSFAEAPTTVEARASAGRVEVVVPEGDELYRVDARADAGDRRVEVRTDPASPRTITARADAGEVVVRYPR